MAQDGFKNIVNIDYSCQVVSNMSSHCDMCSSLIWIAMDARQLSLVDGFFDLIIEKATIDTFLVKNKNPWSLATDAEVSLDQVLTQISRALKMDGKFLSISFSQPHFRLPYYAKPKYSWVVEEVSRIGTNFHHYSYLLQKTSAELSRTSTSFGHLLYQPPVIESSEELNNTSNEDELENNIFNIQLFSSSD